MIDGKYIVNDVAEALGSFDSGELIHYRQDRISEKRRFCMDWLKRAIGA